MRLLKSISIIALITTALVSVTPGVMADGGMSGGGGDAYSQEFVTLGRGVVKYLEVRGAEALPEVDFARLQEAVDQTLVETKDELSLDGREVDAINYPAQKRIELSRKRWRELGEDSEKKLGLMLHEYLGVLRVDDQNYAVTSKFIALWKSAPRLGAETVSCDVRLFLREFDLYTQKVVSEGWYNFSRNMLGGYEFWLGRIGLPESFGMSTNSPAHFAIKANVSGTAHRAQLALFVGNGYYETNPNAGQPGQPPFIAWFDQDGARVFKGTVDFTESFELDFKVHMTGIQAYRPGSTRPERNEFPPAYAKGYEVSRVQMSCKLKK